ncbi:hypothetical protein KVP40.0168 [Vibrio phage KVP40]|uniref:Uncharacterized protein n=1 Tax=Vibrio phage KVP40 (isolate Vibrio parahaemolyticus/Japan/Matsuzaki/1991) TaxID=75320 RepID=Q6WHY6_BPKVM|nr:hypothetical protein KVP40.0168 [Vibrio phage KVP40]AAQ64237.1 hypothetical protein KVP40.0168 [Vibrio phage KVP40]
MNINDVMISHEQIMKSLHRVIESRTDNRIVEITYDKDKMYFIVTLSSSDAVADEIYQWNCVVTNETIVNQMHMEKFR